MAAQEGKGHVTPCTVGQPWGDLSITRTWLAQKTTALRRGLNHRMAKITLRKGEEEREDEGREGREGSRGQGLKTTLRTKGRYRTESHAPIPDSHRCSPAAFAAA